MGNTIFKIFLFIIVLFIAGEIIVPGFIAIRHVMILIQAAFFLGLLSLSQCIVMIAGKSGIDLSVGGILTMGVVIGAAFLKRFPDQLLLAFFVVVLSGLFMGLINGVCISYLDIPPLVMTMAMGSVLMGFALFVTEGVPKGFATDSLKRLSQGHILLGGEGGIPVPIVLIIWAIFVAGFIVFAGRLRPGYQLYALGMNERASRLQGIKTKRVRLFAYGFSGIFAALAGMLMLGYAGVPNLTLGEKHILNSVAAVVIGGVAVEGGRGSYLGAALGAVLIITISSILSTLNLGEGVRQFITGFIILIILFGYRNNSA